MQPQPIPVHPASPVLLDLSRQQRNLLLMRPLFHLDVHKSRLGHDPAVYEDVDVLYLALAALDDMMEGLMTSSGRTEAQVVQHLSGLLEVMKPSLATTNRLALADAVFAALANKKHGYQPFEFRHFDAAGQGWGTVRFRLVEFEQDVHDDYYYRPTREGYQVYLGMLDLDVEDAQEMDEKMLQRLLDRGRFDAALDVARQARAHALEYRDALRNRLTSAMRAPGTVSWTADLGPKVQEATRFVRERRTQAEVSWGLVNDQLRIVEDPVMRQNLARLRDSLEQAADVRLRLVNELLQAPDAFARAQTSVFRARRPSGLPHLENDLLPRLMTLPVPALAAGADAVLAALLPPNPVKLYDLTSSFDLFLERTHRPVVVDEVPVEVKPIPVPVETFPRELVAEVMTWIGQRFAEGVPTDTDTLLVRAAQDGLTEVAQRCVAMTLLRCFAGAPPAGQKQPESPFPQVQAQADPDAWFDHPVATGTNLRFLPTILAQPDSTEPVHEHNPV